MTTNKQTQYRIFLLSVWLEDEADLVNPELWRFRLEEPRQATRLGCVGLSSLMTELSREISGGAVELSVEETHSSDSVTSFTCVFQKC